MGRGTCFSSFRSDAVQNAAARIACIEDGVLTWTDDTGLADLNVKVINARQLLRTQRNSDVFAPSTAFGTNCSNTYSPGTSTASPRSFSGSAM